MSETVNTAVNAAVSSPSANLIPIALIFFIFYHALIKPQRKQAERHETLIRLLKKGDEVMTIGGMVGKVTKVGSDDKINLEIAKGVEITMLKSSVTAYADGSHPAIADKKAKKTSAKMGEKNDNVVPSRNNVANDN